MTLNLNKPMKFRSLTNTTVKEIRFLASFHSPEGEKWVFVLTYENGSREAWTRYAGGFTHESKKEHDWDIINVPEKKNGFVAILEGRTSGKKVVILHDTYQECLDCIARNIGYQTHKVLTIQEITWEE